MRAVDLISKKRDGGRLEPAEIEFFVNGYVDGSIPDYQVSALLMAVFFSGLDPTETGFLTRAMIESGDTIDLSGLSGPLIDKHSTGGVGDKISLALAPVVAACGVQVPMMSGRALGHTGGTLDKLESIPGYRTDITEDRFRTIIAETGYAMTGQSEKIVPADRKMYGLRDVTATVESIPLITASILSKKFAEGAEGLVLDVKAGAGAFMKTQEDARKLAESLHRTGKELGQEVRAVITSMEQPLGQMVGNFLEVMETVDVLRDRGAQDLREVTLRLAAHMLVMGGVAGTLEEGQARAAATLSDGSAWDRFCRNVELQGGDVKVVQDPVSGPRAPVIEDVHAQESGYVVALDAFRVGMASVLLGAGRATQSDRVLPDVGVELLAKCGDSVEADQIIARVYARTQESLKQARGILKQAYRFGDSAPAGGSLILEEITD